MALALAIAPSPAAPSTLQVKVHIDRELGIESMMSLPVGTTVRVLKERLCCDDPTGTAQPEELKLMKVGASRLLKDSDTISADLTEIEILADDQDVPLDEEEDEKKQEERGKEEKQEERGVLEQDVKLEEKMDEKSEEVADTPPTAASKAPEHPEPQEVAAGEQKGATAGEAVADSPERQVFNLLDRNGKGLISQRDVLVALKKQAPIRKLFGLPASKNEKGGDNLDAQLQDIQDAFEAGSGLGKLSPVFDKLVEGGSAKTFDWESFDRVFQTRPHKTRLVDAVAMLPREHKTGPVFVPSQDWQEVPEGTVCPGGLEYKMDMTSQKTLARLAPGQSAGMTAAPVIASTTYKLAPGVEHIFLKRSEDPTKGQIAKVKRSADYRVHSTGRVWVGPSGGRWAEIDASKGEEKGWTLLEGPGFGLKGPALVKHAEDVD